MTSRGTLLGVGVVERTRNRDPNHHDRDGPGEDSESSVKVYYDSETSYQPTCATAQQLVGGLFGFMLGYCIYIIFGRCLLLYIFLSAGSSFGVLGSRMENPFDIDKNHWARLFVLCCCICWPLSWLTYFDMFGILFLSVMVSILSSHADFYLALLARQKESQSLRFGPRSRHAHASGHELDACV